MSSSQLASFDTVLAQTKISDKVSTTSEKAHVVMREPLVTASKVDDERVVCKLQKELKEGNVELKVGRFGFDRSTSSFTQKSQGEVLDKDTMLQVTCLREESNPIPVHGRLLPIGQFLIVYACMSLAVLLNSLDQTIVACILPSIASEFGHSQTSWVGTAYLLTQTAFSPVYGRMSDVFGRKALFIFAMTFFLVGVAMCGSANFMVTLIVGRVVSGIGGAGLFSMVHICISDIVTLRKRGTYHGILSAVNGAGAALGPTVGGLFASRGVSGWRWAFYFQLPIGLVAGLATFFFLPRIGTTDVRLFKAKIKTVDYVGMILFVGGNVMILLSLNLIEPPTVPFVSVQVLSNLFSGLAVLCLFFVWESKYAAQPIVPSQIFKRISIDLVFALNFSFGYVFFATLYYIPEYFQVVHGQDALQSSVSLLPVVMMSIFFSWLTGLATSMTGHYKWSLVVSFVLQTAGSIIVYTQFQLSMSKGVAVTAMLVLGIGFGCQMQCSLVACQSATRQEEVAMTTSVRNFFRNCGGVVGLAVSGCVLNATFQQKLNVTLGPYLQENQLLEVTLRPLTIVNLHTPYVTPAKLAYVRSLNLVYLTFIPMSVIALICAVLLPEYKLERTLEGSPIRQPASLANIARWIYRGHDSKNSDTVHATEDSPERTQMVRADLTK